MLTRNELIDSKKDFESLAHELADLNEQIAEFRQRHPDLLRHMHKIIHKEQLRITTRIHEIDHFLKIVDASSQLIPICG